LVASTWSEAGISMRSVSGRFQLKIKSFIDFFNDDKFNLNKVLLIHNLNLNQKDSDNR